MSYRNVIKIGFILESEIAVLDNLKNAFILYYFITVPVDKLKKRTELRKTYFFTKIKKS